MGVLIQRWVVSLDSSVLPGPPARAVLQDTLVLVVVARICAPQERIAQQAHQSAVLARQGPMVMKRVHQSAFPVL